MLVNLCRRKTKMMKCGIYCCVILPVKRGMENSWGEGIWNFDIKLHPFLCNSNRICATSVAITTHIKNVCNFSLFIVISHFILEMPPSPFFKKIWKFIPAWLFNMACSLLSMNKCHMGTNLPCNSGDWELSPVLINRI